MINTEITTTKGMEQAQKQMEQAKKQREQQELLRRNICKAKNRLETLERMTTCNRQVLFHKFRQIIFHNPRHLRFHSPRHFIFHTCHYAVSSKNDFLFSSL